MLFGLRNYQVIFFLYCLQLWWCWIAFRLLLDGSFPRLRRWGGGATVLAMVPALWAFSRLDFQLGFQIHWLNHLYVLLLILTTFLNVGLSGCLLGFQLNRVKIRRRGRKSAVSPSTSAAGPAEPPTASPVEAPAARPLEATSALALPSPSASIPADAAPASAPNIEAEPEVIQAEVELARRRWLKGALSGFAGLTGLGLVGAAWTDALGLQIRQVTLRFPDLPPEFDGYRILQISDLHSGIFMDYSSMAQVREIAETLSVDLVIHNGDQVDRHIEELPNFVRAFKGLQGSDGVYAVLGNHDYHAGGPAVHAGLNSGGIPVLRNEHQLLNRGGRSLAVVGLDDVWAHFFYNAAGPDLEVALDGVPADAFRLAVVHNPICFHQCNSGKVDAVLAGHTHGGQIYTFFDAISPARIFCDYVHGRYQQDNCQMYVNAGVGYVGLPIRIGVPAEIVVITLAQGPAGG